MATEQEIAEIEAEIQGEVDAIAGDMERKQTEAVTAAIANQGAELIELRAKLADATKQGMREGATITVNAFRKRLGTL